MSLIRYNPFDNRSLTQFVDDFFNRGLTDFVGGDMSFNMPSVNVVEKDNEYQIDVAAPGLEKEDFNLEVDNGLLTISAERKHEDEVKEEGRYMRREFNYTSFSRSFQLPEGLEADEINARYDNGVLRITLPRKEEVKTKTSRVIEIK